MLGVFAAGGREPLPARVVVAEPALDRAALLEGYERAIRDLPFDYRKVGSVLEAIAFVEMRRYFPAPEFELIAGLQYFDATGRTLGELDLVAIQREGDERRVVAVYEVKLSGSHDGAFRAANGQLNRFRRHLAGGTVDHFRVAGHRAEQPRPLKPAHFEGCDRFGLIGSLGSAAAGFDIEFDLRRSEGDVLQRRLLD